LGGSGERRIAVANVSGAFFAIDDTCTHRSCSLGDGALVGAILRCPCHGSRFDLTNGAVLEGPAEKPVRTYPARVVGDEIQVDL
jgi:nitrite reductase/ring-hydroxylating ferredoxin subunit